MNSLKKIVTDSVNSLSSVVEENAASTEETSSCALPEDSSERFLISSATTAKPLPASPALAASILAFNESRFQHLNQEVTLVEGVTKEIGTQTEILNSLKKIVTDSVKSGKSFDNFYSLINISGRIIVLICLFRDNINCFDRSFGNSF